MIGIIISRINYALISDVCCTLLACSSMSYLCWYISLIKVALSSNNKSFVDNIGLLIMAKEVFLTWSEGVKGDPGVSDLLLLKSGLSIPVIASEALLAL